MKFQILVPFSRFLSSHIFGAYSPESLKFFPGCGPTAEAFSLEFRSRNVEMGKSVYWTLGLDSSVIKPLLQLLPCRALCPCHPHWALLAAVACVLQAQWLGIPHTRPQVGDVQRGRRWQRVWSYAWTTLVKLAASPCHSWVGRWSWGDSSGWAFREVQFRCLVHTGRSVKVWWESALPLTHWYCLGPSSAANGKGWRWEKHQVYGGRWAILFLLKGPGSEEVGLHRGGPFQWLQLIYLTLVGRVPEAEKDERHWRGKALMSLPSRSDSERFSGELSILTTKTSQVDQSREEIFVILWDWWLMRGWVESQEARKACGSWGWQVCVVVGEARHVQRGRGWWQCVGDSHIFRAVLCLFYRVQCRWM